MLIDASRQAAKHDRKPFISRKVAKPAKEGNYRFHAKPQSTQRTTKSKVFFRPSAEASCLNFWIQPNQKFKLFFAVLSVFATPREICFLQFHCCSSALARGIQSFGHRPRQTFHFLDLSTSENEISELEQFLAPLRLSVRNAVSSLKFGTNLIKDGIFRVVNGLE